MSKPRICLAMIVKDEAHIIERCLDSVKDHFTEIIIHDTGSTDETIPLVNRWIHANGKHGYITSVAWKDFGHNRSYLLDRCRNCADYTFMMDADEILEGVLNIPEPLCDTYQMQVRLGNISYRRNFLFKTALDWSFKGVVHEYPVCDGDYSTGYIDTCTIRSLHDGARSKDPDKYINDAELLTHMVNPTPRDLFYTAQSWRDAGEQGLACDFYEQRVECGGWFQEVAYSYYMLGLLTESYDAPEYYLRAYETDPRRAEPLLALGKYHMDRQQWHTAALYLETASLLDAEDDMLFREDDVYDWRAQMEYAVCMHYIGDYRHALHLNELIVDLVELPEHIREQVKTNMQFAQDALDAQAT